MDTGTPEEKGKKKNLWVNRAFMKKILFIKALIGKSFSLSGLGNV